MFSNIIKHADQRQPSVKPYAMKDMPLLDYQEVKGRLAYPSTRASSGSGKETEQLLKEIEERERYIKQVTGKTDSLEKEAYEKGFAQGEKAGMELGEKRFDSVVKGFNEVLERVRKIEKELYQKSEQEMVELVLTIARRVIQKEVSTDEKIVLNMIQSALKYVADQKEIKVRLNPSDLEFASQLRGEMMEGMKSVIFEGDEGVPRGDAIIESNRGVIDCGIEKHLREVEENFRAQTGGALKSEGDGLGESQEDHVE